MQFFETRLPNGLQIIAEQSPGVHSVAAGFFVRTGSRDETDDVAGVSHFLEHMAFKGTETETADDVNRIFDELGAKYNASTSEEVTLFYAAVLPEYFRDALKLLSGILRPSLRSADFDSEKQVILEEIGMYDDQPAFTIYEKIMQRHFAGHPLGRSVLGTTESITALTVEQMRAYYAQRYRAGNIVLAVAGKLDWDEVRSLAAEFCGDWTPGDPPRPVAEARPHGGVEIITRPHIQQQHVMQMAAAPPARHPLHFAAELLSVIVGDDTGSRLYWELVDPGHAEMAEIGYNEFDGSGGFLTYFNCDPDVTEENLARVRAIFDEVNQNGVTAAELSRAKNKSLARVVLRSERPMGRLGLLGNNWLYCDEYRSVAQDLDAIRQVTLADIRELLEHYPLGQTTTCTLGPRTELALA